MTRPSGTPSLEHRETRRCELWCVSRENANRFADVDRRGSPAPLTPGFRVASAPRRRHGKPHAHRFDRGARTPRQRDRGACRESGRRHRPPARSDPRVRRPGWNNGSRNCAAWLTWRVGLAPGAAREHVRVARALGTLPLLSQALARGELSYSKVRELTRVATPETEERLLAVGRAGTAEHVQRIVRGWRRMDRKAEVRDAARQHAWRALHVYADEDAR